MLQLLFNSMIEEHMMEARARLDITTQQRPAVVRIFRHVGRISSTSSYGGQIRDAIDAVNSFASQCLITQSCSLLTVCPTAILVQISVLRSLTTRENRSYLALSSLGFLTTLRWLFRSRESITVFSPFLGLTVYLRSESGAPRRDKPRLQPDAHTFRSVQREQYSTRVKAA